MVDEVICTASSVLLPTVTNLNSHPSYCMYNGLYTKTCPLLAIMCVLPRSDAATCHDEAELLHNLSAIRSGMSLQVKVGCVTACIKYNSTESITH
jgi:hypothetical protein